MNESEQLVSKVCRKSFLSFWSYPTPYKDDGDELCDTLVVCSPDVIILSVKDIEFKDTGRPTIDEARWKRRAIEESSKQIYGAERWITNNGVIRDCDRAATVQLPDPSIRRIHRVAVAFGSKEKVPLTFGDFGKGFIHVLDETSLQALMTELDTVSDFVRYLSDKETYLGSGTLTLFSKEEDLLAFYAVSGYAFPTEPTMLVMDDGLWSGFSSAPELLARNKEREVSYLWDNVIERFFENLATDNYRTPWANDDKTRDDLELAVRAMARESRRMRNFLGESISELIGHFTNLSTRARIFNTTESPICYVFMVADYDGNRELSFKELQARCLVARGLDHSKTTVIGILFELTGRHEGDAINGCYIDVPEWTSEWQERMDLYQTEIGFFKNLARPTAR
ncbi:MAG: hypothetical protein KF831_01965 [Acidobacteria bacterium]|nr:hypothetical protein [Acidobacteriota bacterium]